MNKDDEKLVIKNSELREIMKHKNISNNDLAKRMGVAPSTVWRIVNKKRGLTTNMIGKLLRALDMEPDDFDKLFIFSKLLPKDNGVKRLRRENNA